MQLVYFQKSRTNGKTVPNFGDQLNCWMWEEALADMWSPDDGIHFLGIGTIIDKSIIGSSLLAGGGKFVVFSSGVGYGLVPEQFGDPNWQILCVRGPLSARVLGLPPESAIADGAILLSSLPSLRSRVADSGETLFMPHHDSEFVGHWKAVCQAAGFIYLSPTSDSRETVERLRSAKLVLADAMHAAVVADAFRVPWIPLSTSSYINTFKWLDWTLSLKLPYDPIVLPPSSSLEVLREQTLAACGKRFRVTPPTAEAALEDFECKRIKKSSRLWTMYSEVASKALCSVPGRLYNLPLSGSLRSKDQNRYVERAAQALYQASRGQQFLSKSSIHASKQTQMWEKMQDIPKIVNKWSRLKKDEKLVAYGD